jgi:hypothetical protein
MLTLNKLLHIEHPVLKIAVGMRLSATPWKTRPFPTTCPLKVRIELVPVGINWHVLTILLPETDKLKL